MSMSALEELFYEAKKLFGDDSELASHVQNKGTIQTQEQVEMLLWKVKEHLKQHTIDVNSWQDSLMQAFKNGDC